MVELKKIQTMMVGIMFLLLGVTTTTSSCSDGDLYTKEILQINS